MRRLIILGASVRAAAFSALRAGFSPYAIDLFADRDLAAVCPAVTIARYPRGFLNALAAAPTGSPWMYTGGLENYPRLVDRLATIRPLLGNGGDVVRAVRDPFHLADVVRSAGFAFPDTTTTRKSTFATGRRWRSSGIGDAKWLVKPRRSSGGLAIRFAADRDLVRPLRGTYLQHYIDGQAASAVFVAAGGRPRLLGVSRQLLGRDFGLEAPFLYVGSLAPLPLRRHEVARLEVLGSVLAAEFGLVGLFNVDFVRTSDNLWPVEVNPRYSSSVEVLERVAPHHCVGLHVAACADGVVPAARPVPRTTFAGKAVVYARQATIVPPGLDELVAAWNRANEPPMVADLPQTGQRISASHPVVTVFAEGSSEASVEGQLRRRVSEVEQMLASDCGR